MSQWKLPGIKLDGPVPRPLLTVSFGKQGFQGDGLSVGLTSSQVSKEVPQESTRAIRRLKKTAFKMQEPDTPSRTQICPSLESRTTAHSVSPTPPSRKTHAVDASGHPPLANPSLRLVQEPNISNPRQPYEQPQAFDHTTLPDDFSHMSDRSVSRHSIPKTPGMSEIDSENASAGTALNMRLSSAPQHRRRAVRERGHESTLPLCRPRREPHHYNNP